MTIDSQSFNLQNSLYAQAFSEGLLLGLYTFNNSYLMAVPSSYIESEDENNTVIISDNSFTILVTKSLITPNVLSTE